MHRLILFFVLVSGQCFSQKHYVFEVQDVHTYPDAKPVISLIRNTWNQEDPRLFFPVFHSENGQFTADSGMPLSEDVLRNLLASEGYTLISFQASETTPQPKIEGQ